MSYRKMLSTCGPVAAMETVLTRALVQTYANALAKFLTILKTFVDESFRVTIAFIRYLDHAPDGKGHGKGDGRKRPASDGQSVR